VPILNLNPIIGPQITQHQQEPTLSDNNMIWTTRSRLTNKLPRLKKRKMTSRGWYTYGKLHGTGSSNWGPISTDHSTCLGSVFRGAGKSRRLPDVPKYLTPRI